MTFEEILDQAIAMLQRRRRVTYSTLKLQFQLDDVQLAALKDELLYSQQPHVVDDAGHGLVWTGETVVKRETQLNIANGVFAVACGFLYLIVFGGSWLGIINLKTVSPDTLVYLFYVWLLVAAFILLWWGCTRIYRVYTGKDPWWRVDQPTMNFVLVIVGATIALLALVKQSSPK
jgi:hypothetical protein